MNEFTVKQFGSGQYICAGKIIGCQGDLIFVQVTQNFEDIRYCYDKENQLFTLNFVTNGLVYKVLLNTMQWFEKHRLHAVLINNQRYDQVDYLISKANKKNFSCPLSETLNEEQKSAIQHIVGQQKHGIPIILHGPPGRIK